VEVGFIEGLVEGMREVGGIRGGPVEGMAVGFREGLVEGKRVEEGDPVEVGLTEGLFEGTREEGEGVEDGFREGLAVKGPVEGEVMGFRVEEMGVVVGFREGPVEGEEEVTKVDELDGLDVDNFLIVTEVGEDDVLESASSGRKCTVTSSPVVEATDSLISTQRVDI